MSKEQNLNNQQNQQLNITGVTISCEPKTPIIAINVSYSNGRFSRYVNFTCPKCSKKRSEAVWSDNEHIDPDTYDCECGVVLIINVKEHRLFLRNSFFDKREATVYIGSYL